MVLSLSLKIDGYKWVLVYNIQFFNHEYIILSISRIGSYDLFLQKIVGQHNNEI